MDYTTTDKVNRLLGPHEVKDTTKVTLEDTEVLIRAVESEMNTLLGALGVDPIPVVIDEPITTYLGTVAAWGVAAQVLKATFPETTGPGESPAFAYWEKKYQDALKWLGGEEGSAVLVSVGIVTAVNAQASSYFTNHPTEEAELGYLAGASLFTVDNLHEKNW